MSLRRQVMRNMARREAEDNREYTRRMKVAGGRRDKRALIRAAFASLGSPSARDGSLRIYGERADYRKERAYAFMEWNSEALEIARRVQRTRKNLIPGRPGRRIKVPRVGRPWAGCLV